MITIAGGTGSVGSKLTNRLLDEREHVRVLTRDRVAAARLFGRRESLELVEVDLTDRATLIDAFRGSDRAFLSTGTSGTQVRDEKALIDAAVTAGVPWLVNLSVGGMDSGVDNPVFDWHREIDEHLRAAGTTYTTLRPSTFIELLVQLAANFAPSGNWGGDTGAGRGAAIDTRDIADVAAAVLLDGPARHAGRAYDLTGPTAITLPGLAATLSDGLGTSVVYHQRTTEQHRAVLASAGLPPLMVDVLIGVDNATRASVFAVPTTAVRDLTGHDARDPEAYVKENLALFAA